MTALYSMSLPLERVNITFDNGVEFSYGFNFMETAERFIETNAGNENIVDMYLIRSKA